MGLEQVLAVLRSNKGGTQHLMEIVAELGVGSEQRDRVRAALDDLREQKLVQELPGQRYRVGKPPRSGHGPDVPEVRSLPT
ncbi:MAG TPA: hypothetical protein VFX59_31070, partial [Polyangiales bacterium]|nr:hypothetical protein [Polyangiales bacterium]